MVKDTAVELLLLDVFGSGLELDVVQGFVLIVVVRVQSVVLLHLLSVELVLVQVGVLGLRVKAVLGVFSAFLEEDWVGDWPLTLTF